MKSNIGYDPSAAPTTSLEDPQQQQQPKTTTPFFHPDETEMFVTKRNGKTELVSFDKILKRIKNCNAVSASVEDPTTPPVALPPLKINYTNLAMKVIDQLYNKISTTKIDELCAEQCAAMVSIHPDYSIIASKIIISNHHRDTPTTFSKAMGLLYKYKNKEGVPAPMLSDEFHAFVHKNAQSLDALCGDCKKDYLLDYFGFKTLEKSYLMRINGKIIERPQYLFLRVAVGIHIPQSKTQRLTTAIKKTPAAATASATEPQNTVWNKIAETYHYMSNKYFTHATPTLFNAGTPHPQLSSCFLEAMESDSIEGIYNTVKDCALISKWAGGIGLHIHNIRATGSHIHGTNGSSNGIIPMLKVFNNTARYVDQGGGKRNGSFAIYLEPWHADVEGFLNMRKNHGDEELKARDLFYALWIPDLFMERIKKGGKWTLMSPDECPHLSDLYGENFNQLYIQYENEGRGRKTMNARDLWFQILDAQMETGTPYLLYKDAMNNKSNQKNIGTIKSSNLCVAPETKILTDKGHVEIQTLHGQKVNVWNGEEYSEVEIVKTGKNQELLEIETNDGSILNCTKYHKFYIQNSFNSNKIEITEAQHLKIGDKITAYQLPEDLPDGKIRHIQIKRITDNGRRDDTYCFTEPKRNAGIFNGIYTSQCAEIAEYSDEHETAVCNLASIALPSFIDPPASGGGSPTFNYEKLHSITRLVTFNLNRVIDVNYYPIEKTRVSNMRHRPIGIGIQGLADVFMLLDVPFFSETAKEINRHIFETIYHAALTESCEIAKTEGYYETFPGSPTSQGILQFDLWSKPHTGGTEAGGRYDWDALKKEIQQHGLRNSLLVATMPTASTSQILGFNECFEPITSNIYSRRTLAGEFIVANKYLMNDLIKIDMWNEKIKNNIIANNGSIQQIDTIPQTLRDKYRTVWEIPMRHLIDMSAERGVYICQSQSLNLWLEDPNYNNMTSMYFHGWTSGLKTGIYYLRRRARHQAQQFTIEPTKKDSAMTPTEEICELCSS